MSDSLQLEWIQFLHENAFANMTSSLSSSAPPQQQQVDKKSLFGMTPPTPLLLLRSPPKCEELTISTKTKVLHLNAAIDIESVFWEMPVMKYWLPQTGVLKKTIKLVCLSRDRVCEIQTKLEELRRAQGGNSRNTSSLLKEEIIRQIDVPERQRPQPHMRKFGQPYYVAAAAAAAAATMTLPAHFKDERKISVGISKKDILAARWKKSKVFYNCLALVVRVLYRGSFREVHVKVFNTGKMEIPGVFNDELLELAREMVLSALLPCARFCSPHKPILSNSGGDGDGGPAEDDDEEEDELFGFKLQYTKDGSNEDDFDQNVLINSNFNCGFFIHREKLLNVLRGAKYNLDCSFDPCIYPGVKCKFYFNHEVGFDKERQRGVIDSSDWNLKMKSILGSKKYSEVTIMLFRTGSGLIGANCTEKIIRFVFDFIAQILHDEYANIAVIDEKQLGFGNFNCGGGGGGGSTSSFSGGNKRRAPLKPRRKHIYLKKNSSSSSFDLVAASVV